MPNANNSQQPNRDIKARIELLRKEFGQFCRHGVKAAEQSKPREDWWYVQKVHWCMQLEDLLTQVGQVTEARMTTDDIKYLASRNRAALQFVKDHKQHAEMVTEIEMSDLINQPLAVQIERIQEFTEYDTDEKLAAEMPCSVQAVRAWKSGKVSQPTIGYRKAVHALACRAMCIWPMVRVTVCPHHATQIAPPGIH